MNSSSGSSCTSKTPAVRSFCLHTPTLDDVFLAVTASPAIRPDQEATRV